ncbi:hypothetical protein JQ581_29830 [Bradyrhizobium liaoningense]|uniref:hypothetical protein n=1 Tax=Bradyrhizobium liaoningense TaxID=43992 RepID=UPI001BA6EDB5|nr:hypothetical protein [Bradyrhizobium liaoningense]MBR0741139.1 hypothetical protein [Bradyrhizobium liaoningense]
MIGCCPANDAAIEFSAHPPPVSAVRRVEGVGAPIEPRPSSFLERGFHVDQRDCFNQFGGDDVDVRDIIDIGRVSDIGDIVLASGGL